MATRLFCHSHYGYGDQNPLSTAVTQTQNGDVLIDLDPIDLQQTTSDCTVAELVVNMPAELFAAQLRVSTQAGYVRFALCLFAI